MYILDKEANKETEYVCDNCGAIIDEYEYFSNSGVCDRCFEEEKSKNSHRDNFYHIKNFDVLQ